MSFSPQRTQRGSQSTQRFKKFLCGILRVLRGSSPWLAVGLFVVLATVYSVVVPLFEGNDESWHYAYVWHIKSEKALPRQPPEQYPHLARQEASQPPLYYLLAAGLTAGVVQDDLMALYGRENPYPTLWPIGYRDNQNHYIHTDAERFPYRGAALAIHLARLLSVLFGAGTVWATYHLGRLLFPQERTVAVAAAWIVALTPGFLLTAGLVNNDALGAFLATSALVLLARMAKGDTSWRTAGLLGLTLGAAALNKLSGLLLWPFAALVLVAIGWRKGLQKAAVEVKQPHPRVAFRRRADLTPASPSATRPLSQGERGQIPSSPCPVGEGKGVGGRGEVRSPFPLAPRERGRRSGGWSEVSLLLMAAVFGVAVLICGWWYARNYILYGDVTGLRPMLAMVGRREAGFGLREWLRSEGELIYLSYWAVFGWFNLAAPRWVYVFFTLLTVAGGGGLIVFLARALRRRDGRSLRAVGFLGLWALVVLAGLVRWTLTTGGSQGRLLYPAIGAISLLLARGGWELFPRRGGTALLVGIGAALLLVAVYLPFGVIVPAYARPVLRGPEEVAKAVPHQTDVRFGDGIRLLGYGVDQEEVRPGETLWVTLCWQGERPVDADYFVWLALQTEDGLTAGRRETHPGLGTFPTSHWPVGAAFCDRYPLPVRDTVPVQASGVLAVGLTTFTERLPVYNARGDRLGDTFLFPGPRIVVPEGGPALAYEWGHRVALVGYRLDRSVLAPGDELEITLRWRALRDCPQCVATVQVLQGMDKIGQSDILLAIGEPGTLWVDQRRIPLSPEATPGVYDIRVGVYDAATLQRLPLYGERMSVVSGGLLSLWQLRVVERDDRLGATCADIPAGAVPARARFGQGLQLCGYTLSSQCQPGAEVTVTLYWELAEETDRPLNGFVHFLGTRENPETGNALWRQADKVLNLSWWLPGLHGDTYTFQIAPSAPAGEYWLEVGVWDPQTGERLPHCSG